MNREPVERLIQACNERDVDAALQTFAPDALYHNMPLDPVRGNDAIRAVLEPFLGLASEVDWVVHRWADGAEGVVMTERTDRFLIDDQWLELPVMGVFEVEAGKIKAWRDYFDMQPLAPLLSRLG